MLLLLRLLVSAAQHHRSIARVTATTSVEITVIVIVAVIAGWHESVGQHSGIRCCAIAVAVVVIIIITIIIVTAAAVARSRVAILIVETAAGLVEIIASSQHGGAQLRPQPRHPSSACASQRPAQPVAPRAGPGAAAQLGDRSRPRPGRRSSPPALPTARYWC